MPGNENYAGLPRRQSIVLAGYLQLGGWLESF